MPDSRRVRTRRWLIPALLIVAWLTAGGLLGPLAGKLGEVVESGAAAYLPRSAEATEVLDLMQRFGEPEAMPAVLVYDAGGTALDDADRAAVAADVQAVGAALGPHLAAPPIGPEIAEDGRAARVVLLFSGTDETKITPHVERLRELVVDRPGLSAHVTGPAGVQADVQDALGAIDLMLLLITAAVILVILVLVYRSPLLPFVVLAVAGTALGVTQGVIYLLADRGVLALGSEVQGILSVLVIGAATDYALLLIARYREELRVAPDRHVALRAALRASAGPIVASAGTIALGLLCLLLSDLGLNRQLGPAGAIGIACAVVAMLTFLPAVLALLGPAAFWPRRPAASGATTDGAGRWARVVALVGRRPRAVWAGTAVVLAVLSLGVLRIDADGLSATEMLIAGNTESTVGQQVLAEHFPAGSGSPVIVVADADALPAVVAAAREVPDVAEVVPFSRGGAAPTVVDGLARADVTLAVAPDSQAATDAVLALRSAVHAIPGASAKVGGTTAVDVDFDATARADRVVIPVLLVVVFVIILLLLRALVASVLLLATVVLSFLAAIGVSTVVFQDLLGFPGVDSTFPLHAFVFLVALGVDYNIFLVSRVREESARFGTRRGVARGLAVTGGVITSAGVVLAATFAALAVIPLVLMVELAFTVAFGVLLDTLIVRTLLVPALFADVGRFIWWPGRLTGVRDTPAQGPPSASLSAPPSPAAAARLHAPARRQRQPPHPTGS
ncbi:MMPL family transporter [Micromonospora sp. DT31]|uniref:MMPL family transporter n=1 Tax=Micromonospora sp. DT31 TaxID=3393434 RepID=UPI003CF0F42B